MNKKTLSAENVKLQIRNSTAEFLIFTSQSGENSVRRKFRRTSADGKEYNTKFYNLEAGKLQDNIIKNIQKITGDE